VNLPRTCPASASLPPPTANVHHVALNSDYDAAHMLFTPTPMTAGFLPVVRWHAGASSRTRLLSRAPNTFASLQAARKWN